MQPGWPNRQVKKYPKSVCVDRRLALGGARRTIVGFVMDYDFVSRGLQPITVRNVEPHAGKASLSRVYSAPLFR